MRIALLAFVAILVVVLGGLQTVAAVALRAKAADASLPHAAPAALVHWIATLDPQTPLPQALRRVLAAAAIDARDYPRAEAYVRTMRASSDRHDLRGKLEDARGDESFAIREYLLAGDSAAFEKHVDAAVSRGDIARALGLQGSLIAILSGTTTDRDALAQAYYRGGLLDQTLAYSRGVTTSAGSVEQRNALGYYLHATALAPLEERYGIALGNQYLNMGDLASARSTFEHLRDLDPASVEPLTGLADAAIRSHDLRAAGAYLDAADRIAPASPEIAHMRAKLAHP